MCAGPTDQHLCNHAGGGDGEVDKPLNEEQLAKVNTQDLEYRWGTSSCSWQTTGAVDRTVLCNCAGSHAGAQLSSCECIVPRHAVKSVPDSTW